MTEPDPLVLRYDPTLKPDHPHNLVALLRNPCEHSAEELRAARLAAADLIAAWLTPPADSASAALPNLLYLDSELDGELDKFITHDPGERSGLWFEVRKNPNDKGYLRTDLVLRWWAYAQDARP